LSYLLSFWQSLQVDKVDKPPHTEVQNMEFDMESWDMVNRVLYQSSSDTGHYKDLDSLRSSHW